MTLALTPEIQHRRPHLTSDTGTCTSVDRESDHLCGISVDASDHDIDSATRLESGNESTPRASKITRALWEALRPRRTHIQRAVSLTLIWIRAPPVTRDAILRRETGQWRHCLATNTGTFNIDADADTTMHRPLDKGLSPPKTARCQHINAIVPSLPKHRAQLPANPKHGIQPKARRSEIITSGTHCITGNLENYRIKMRPFIWTQASYRSRARV